MNPENIDDPTSVTDSPAGTETLLQRCRSLLDALRQRISLQRQTFAGDAWGGLAAMLVALPSAIAFGVTIFSPLGGALAAQGALAGMLGAITLGLIAPAFGGSSRLITAPSAPAAAVLSALAINFAHDGVPAAVVLLLLGLIGLLAGSIQIALGLVRIGQLIRFIPFPVVSGYMSGVGLIIIGSQIPRLLGSPNGSSLLEAIAMPSAWQWQGIMVGAIVIATMALAPRLTRQVPAAILALLAGVACYLLLSLADPALLNTEHNPLLIGTLAHGSGSLTDTMLYRWQTFGMLDPGTLITIAVPALTLAVLLSIDSLKTCVVVDAMTGSHHDSNRELIGQGLGNISSVLIGGVPGSGTMGASLINISSGGTTRVSGAMAGLFSLAAFLLLAPLMAWIPVAALAAILIVVGARMIDHHSLAFFFAPATRLDFLVIISVIMVAIFGNLIAASGGGVVLSILLFLREQTRSSVIRNRIQGDEIFLKRAHKLLDSQSLTRIAAESVVFELQGSLFFGTASQLQAALEPEIGSRKYIILSMRRVQSLDVTATHMLEQIKDRLEEKNGYLVFCDIPKHLPSGLKIKRYLRDTGVVQKSNKAFAFRQLDDALEWVMQQESPDSIPETQVMELNSIPIFAGCQEDVLASLQAAMEIRSFKAGEYVFNAGSEDDALYLMRRGSVKISLPIRKKENYHLATSGPGEFIGGMGFLEADGHATDALALTDVEVYVLSRRNFIQLTGQHSHLALAIIENVALTLSSRLRVTISELQALRG